MMQQKKGFANCIENVYSKNIQNLFGIKLKTGENDE